MDNGQRISNLMPPKGRNDIVIDTDTYNEIDDQFAVSYLLRSQDKVNISGICAAPFSNSRYTPKEGMEASYNEIFKLLKLANEEWLCPNVYRGSETYLKDEKTPVESDAAKFIAELANEYSPEHPLYIVAIGAISNVASAILMNSAVKETACSYGFAEMLITSRTIWNTTLCRISREQGSPSALEYRSFSSPAEV